MLGDHFFLGCRILHVVSLLLTLFHLFFTLIHCLTRGRTPGRVVSFVFFTRASLRVLGIFQIFLHKFFARCIRHLHLFLSCFFLNYFCGLRGEGAKKSFFRHLSTHPLCLQLHFSLENTHFSLLGVALHFLTMLLYAGLCLKNIRPFFVVDQIRVNTNVNNLIYKSNDIRLWAHTWWPASFTDRAHCFDPFFVYAGAISVFFSLHLLLLLVDERELLLFDGALRPSCFYSAQKWFNFAYNSFFDSYSDVSSFIPWFVFVNFKVVAFHLALLFRRIALSSSTMPKAR